MAYSFYLFNLREGVPPEIKEEKKNTVTAQPRIQHHRRKSSEQSQLGVGSGKKKRAIYLAMGHTLRNMNLQFSLRKTFMDASTKTMSEDLR